MPDDALEKFLEEQRNKPKATPDPAFEEKERKLYVRQLAERDALQKQHREETARVGASKQLEQRHDQEIAKLTEKFEKQREVFYRDNTPQKTAAVQDPTFIADKVAALPLYKEMQSINAKDGPFTEAEKKRIDVLNKILDAEADLRKTLVALDARQKKETEDLVQKQRREPSPTFGQQYADLEKRHDKERDRYIREHANARRIADDLKQREKIDALTMDDGPKRSR